MFSGYFLPVKSLGFPEGGLSYLFNPLAGVHYPFFFFFEFGVRVALKLVSPGGGRAALIMGLMTLALVHIEFVDLKCTDSSCRGGTLHFTAGFLSSQGPQFLAAMPREISGVSRSWEMVHS